MKETEIERVFLVKELPKDLSASKKIIIKVGEFIDSNTVDTLKIKQKDDRFFLIKKDGNTVYNRTEHVISIKKEEFDVLWKTTIRNHEKIRYLYPLGGYICEIDFYQGILKGYSRLEVEFRSEKEMDEFKIPGWFGPEITEFNHDIHANLGKITFKEMKERYLKKGIDLKKIKI